MAVIITSTHFAYLQRDSQAELAWHITARADNQPVTLHWLLRMTRCHLMYRVCVVVGSVLLMDEAKNDTVPLLSNGGQSVAISMDGIGVDKQRYQQQLQLIDEQVNLSCLACIIVFLYKVGLWKLITD